MTKKLERNIDDFARKMIQKSVVENFKKYVKWQREFRRSGNSNLSLLKNNIHFAPFSINLDITTACNYRCGFCVDIEILNTAKPLPLSKTKQTIMTLAGRGLKSIILIGGGEPTLHPDFETVVRFIKGLGIELGIVTNGSRMDKIITIADCLDKRDWVRLSLNSASEQVFQALHKPPRNVHLENICLKVKEFKVANRKTPVGFSYIIFWEGCSVDGRVMPPNVAEIPLAVKLTIENDFDYISFKPSLVKSNETHKRETLLYGVSMERQTEILNQIAKHLSEAKSVAGEKIKESINLRSLLYSDNYDDFKKQPRNCHSQVFRWVVSPIGIFHCPAYRGDEKAKMSEKYGCNGDSELSETINKNLELLVKFNATEECKDIVCFYNGINWYIERLIQSSQGLDSIEPVADDNFFL